MTKKRIVWLIIVIVIVAYFGNALKKDLKMQEEKRLQAEQVQIQEEAKRKESEEWEKQCRVRKKVTKGQIKEIEKQWVNILYSNLYPLLEEFVKDLKTHDSVNFYKFKKEWNTKYQEDAKNVNCLWSQIRVFDGTQQELYDLVVKINDLGLHTVGMTKIVQGKATKEEAKIVRQRNEEYGKIIKNYHELGIIK